MKYKIIILFFLVAVFLCISCNDDIEWVEMTFTESGCMNPWDHFTTSKTDKLEIIKAYLSDQNIWVKQITTQKYSDGPFCLSCACPTGILIIIQIPESDLEKAEEIGFSRMKNNEK